MLNAHESSCGASSLGPYRTHEGVGLADANNVERDTCGFRGAPAPPTDSYPFSSSNRGISIGALGVAFGFLDMKERRLNSRRAVKYFFATVDRRVRGYSTKIGMSQGRLTCRRGSGRHGRGARSGRKVDTRCIESVKRRKSL